MSASLSIQLNGQPRSFELLPSPTTVAALVEALALKSDRIAIECNGEIAPRITWTETPVANGDKIEIVHFVGGGSF